MPHAYSNCKPRSQSYSSLPRLPDRFPPTSLPAYTTVALLPDFIPSLSTPTPSPISPPQTAISLTSSQPSPAHPTPQILWIGCSDSLISETLSLAVDPEEIFVHRNLGNIISNGDLSSASALEWAVSLLGVRHVVVCGHYECVLLSERDGEELGGWHRKFTQLCTTNQCNSCSTDDADAVSAADDDRIRKSRCRIEELHVLAEVQWLREQPVVKQAIEQRGLRVHGFVYNRETGGCVRLVEMDL